VTSPFVGVHVIYRPGAHYVELVHYVYYLAKDGAAEDGGPGEHSTREGQEPDIPTVLKRLWKAPWCFKVVVSPTMEAETRLSVLDFARSCM
jgi:hypothetical protein